MRISSHLRIAIDERLIGGIVELSRGLDKEWFLIVGGEGRWGWDELGLGDRGLLRFCLGLEVESIDRTLGVFFVELLVQKLGRFREIFGRLFGKWLDSWEVLVGGGILFF